MVKFPFEPADQLKSLAFCYKSVDRIICFKTNWTLKIGTKKVFFSLTLVFYFLKLEFLSVFGT